MDQMSNQVDREPPLSQARERFANRADSPEVLVVDDYPAIREATALLLEIKGYRVITAGSLAEAREVAMGHPQIDILLTDYHLGNTETGVQVIVELEKLLGRHLEWMLITGDPAAVPARFRSDPLRIARKPVGAAELLARLKALMEP
jgi:CheY-like chemotaxis protein